MAPDRRSLQVGISTKSRRKEEQRECQEQLIVEISKEMRDEAKHV